MRIRSVGHACLELETNGLRIVSDPWWEGPAYHGQWHPWPAPRPEGLAERTIDYLYLSHGHEDHLHVPTLRTLRRSGTTVLVPELVAGALAPSLRDELGFCEVVELRHGRTVPLRRGLRATCYLNVTDSILVLEDGDRVLVNANDALHASPPAVIDHFCRLLRARHPSIDTLFLGFSGASWFPNCLHLPGKHDRSAAIGRERLFTENFVHVVSELRPRIASAFAASFVLPDPRLRWINEVKLEVPAPDEAFRARYPNHGTRAHLLLPGDVIDGVELVPGTTPRPTQAGLAATLEGPLAPAVRAFATPSPLSDEAVRDLLGQLDRRVRAHASRLRGRPPFAIDLRLRDHPGFVIGVRFDGRAARIEPRPARRADATLELRASILEAAMQAPYGLESITIGYGAIATLGRPEDLAKVNELLALIAPRRGSLSAVADELRGSPPRAMGALWSQRWPLAYALGARLGLLSHPHEWRGLLSEPIRPDRAAA